MRLATLKYGAFRLPCDLQRTCSGNSISLEHISSRSKIFRVGTCYASGAKVIFESERTWASIVLPHWQLRPSATVHAFEATPEIANRLREAAVLNNLSRLHVHAVAASSHTGFAKLNRCRGEIGT